MSDNSSSSKTQTKPTSVKPMMALQGYLDDMLSVATESVAQEEVSQQNVTEPLAVVEVAEAETAEIETVEIETVEIESTNVDVEPKSTPKEESVLSSVKEEALYTEHKPTSAVKLKEKTKDSTVSKVLTSTLTTQDVSLQEVTTPPSEAVAAPAETSRLELQESTSESKEDKLNLSGTPSLSDKAVTPKGETLGYPNWAASGFECLLFYVGGLKLAVPLILLGGIHRIDKDLTPLFGQPDWFLGLYPRNTMDGQQNIRVVHTSRWVMPEKQSPDIDPVDHYVISLGDSDWGLLSHKLSDSIRLSPDQVKWRTSVGKRPWLAGTVIDHMCAILDVNQMVELLDKNSKRIA